MAFRQGTVLKSEKDRIQLLRNRALGMGPKASIKSDYFFRPGGLLPSPELIADEARLMDQLRWHFLKLGEPAAQVEAHGVELLTLSHLASCARGHMLAGLTPQATAPGIGW